MKKNELVVRLAEVVLVEAVKIILEIAVRVLIPDIYSSPYPMSQVHWTRSARPRRLAGSIPRRRDPSR